MPKPDYPGAIWYPAHPSNWGYRDAAGRDFRNIPAAWVFHTPEEPADNYPSTPYYFGQPNRVASTTYFDSYLGFIWQCVEEQYGAYGNALIGKPMPSIFAPGLNLNLQTLSVEVEGCRATIMQTMNERQWMALVNLIRARSPLYGIPLDRQHLLGHYEVASNRSDPGPEFMAELVRRVQVEGDDMFTDQDRADLKEVLSRTKPALVKMQGRPEVYVYDGEVGELTHITSPEVLTAAGWSFEDARELPPDHPLWTCSILYPAGVPRELR